MINSNYEIVQVLYENFTTIIYKARHIADDIPVIIKVYKNPEDSYIIKYEYDILKRRKIRGIANVLSMEYDQRNSYLIMEDKQGVVLQSYLESRVISEIEFITIAKNAASSLRSIHDNHILHRDIKPANILIDPETLNIYYIDFGISVDLEVRESSARGGLQGTLEYISPEQTGRINMEVDYRSDLYSLGITLYQLLTGRTPFKGSTTMELIHAHIAVAPEPPTIYCSVNQTISDIILKLLKKSPDERYQSAGSLEKDFGICLDTLNQGYEILPFSLGTGDSTTILSLDDMLYGKDMEFQELKAAFDEIPGCKGELILMEGLPASGKSLLVAEFEKYVLENNGCFFHGKYDYGDKNESYYAIKMAVRHYLEYAEQMGINIQSLRALLMKRLSDNVGALISMFPFMEEFLGKQPPLLPLSFIENQHRNEQVFKIFLQTIAAPAHPIVFFIDNVHLGDYGSLRLLLSVLSDKNTRDIIVLWSYRSNEVENNRGFKRILSELSDKSFKVHKIIVNYLTLSGVYNLLKESFGECTSNIDELADYIFLMTDGKPYEIINLIKLLSDKNLIAFDAGTQSLTWNMEKITRTELNIDADSTYIDMMKKFTYEQAKALKYIAACGAEVKLDYLKACFAKDKTERELNKLLQLFMDSGVLKSPYPNYYTFEDRLFRMYCYNLLSEKQKADIHYTIGMNLLMMYSNDNKKKETYCSDITDHLNLSTSADFNEAEKIALAELNLMSGNTAFSAGDSMKALSYYKKGVELLGEDAFTNHYQLIFELYLKCSECHFANGSYDITHEITSLLLLNVQTERDKYALYSSSMRQYMSMSHYSQVIELGEEYLKGRGFLLNECRDEIEAVAFELEFYKQYLENLPIDTMLASGYSKDIEVLQNGSILALMTSAMWTAGDQRAEYYHLRAGRYAYENGLFDGFETIFENGALRMAIQMNFKRAEALIHAALEYSKQHNAPKSTAYIYYCSQIIHWTKPLKEARSIYVKAKNTAMLEGKLHATCYADLARLNASAFMTENVSKYLKEVELAIEYAKKVNYSFCYEIFTGVLRQCGKCLGGKTYAPNSLEDKHFREEEFLNRNKSQPIIIGYYYSYKVWTLCLNCCYDDALVAMNELKERGIYLGALILVVLNNFFYSYLLLQLSDKYPVRKEKYMQIVAENQKILERWAGSCEENFLARFLLIEAEIARIDNNTNDLMALYSKVWELLNETGEVSYVEGMLQESMYKYWEKKKIRQYSYYHSERTYQIFKSLRANARTALIVPPDKDTDYAKLDEFNTISYSTSSMNGTLPVNNHSLDSEMILKIIGLLSQNLDISTLSDKLLAILIQVSGASKGFIAVNMEGAFIMEAAYFSDVSAEQAASLILPEALSAMDEKTVPVGAMEHVLHKKITITVNSINERYLFFNDIYFRIHDPESFVCLPILLKESVTGVIYLENSVLSGVFTKERLEVIHTITMQSAVILQNAVYYNELSTYAKTVELRLKDYNNIQNSLIAGIAHEINTPIGVCVTVISRLEELTKETVELFSQAKLSKANLGRYLDKTLDGINIANANISRAVELISNFKKVSVDQSNEVFEELYLSQTLKNITEYIRPAIKKKINKIAIIGDESLKFVSCPGTLTQIFTNLIMNSVIHGFENKPKDDCKITIKFKRENKYVQIIYTDNGRGMTEEQLEKLFQPFYTTKRNQGGSGLGTHIILSLVTQKLNGSINCVSVPGKGTSFILQIPIKEYAAEL